MRTAILSTLLRTLMAIGLVMVFLPILPVQASGIAYRVKPDGTDNGTCGETWDSACSLQHAINLSGSGDQVWVAAGTYNPTSGTDRTISFMLKNGVSVYGGFAGTEGNLLQRDPTINVTLLSGDIGIPGDNSDNSYHVVNGNQVDHSSILDGLTISDGNANGDYPHSRGGGMFNYSSDPTLLNVTFSNNSALDLGGGVYNYKSNPSLTDVLFSGNFAQQRGGGIYNYTSNPTLLNVSFLGNSAQDLGGGMNSFESSLTVTNVIFSNNTATTSGGGMFNFGSNVTLTNATFSDNSAKNGAGMYNSYHGDITVMNVTFDGNSAQERGGGMYNYLSDPIMTDVTFTGNTAKQHGGGMFNGTSNPVLTNVIFSANTTDSYGGGMNNNDSSPTLNEVTFINNTAEYGGGIYNWDYSSPTLIDTTFSNNSAVYRGGGMFSTTSSNFNLTHVSFTNNTSQDLGGGMFTADSNPSLNDVAFIANTALDSGGGLYNISSNAVLTDVTFSGNISKNGGGMNNKYGNPILTHITFDDNVAQERGGGMFNYEGDPTLTDVSFTGNTAQDLGGGMFTSTSNLLLDHVNFTANSTLTSGGGIYNSYSHTTLTDVTFSGNTSNNNGGGMGSNNSDLILTNVTISGNSAQQRGGGMFTYLGDHTLTNVSFAGNTAEQNGGGMFNSGGSLMLTSATFSNNNAGIYGGGIAIDETNTTINNTIFWGNTAVTTGSQIYSFHSGMPLINDSVIENGCPTGSVCANILTTDPLLGILGNYGGFIQTIPLQTGSSAIDTGNDLTSPSTDARGVTRPQGLHCDIGAYEVYLYSISGHVLDTQGIPIPGVTVSDGLGHSDVTDSSGYYSIPGLTSGEYTITSTKSGYSFSPTDWAVIINEDNVSSMDFEGDSTGGFFKINPDDGSTGLNSLTTSWSPNSGASYYEVCADTTNDTNCSTSWVSAGDATSYDFPLGSFLPDTTYYWQVRAVNSTDTTYADEDTWWSFTTVSHSPADDEILTTSKVTFDWNDVENAELYKIRLSTQEDFSTLDFKTNVQQSEFPYETPLKYCKTYYWQIKAKVEGIWGAWSPVWKFDSMDPLAAPELLSPPDTKDPSLTSGSVTLSWDSVLNGYQYKVQVSQYADFSVKLVKEKLDASVLTKELTGLADDKYYWRVRAIDASGGKGPWSEVWIFKVVTP